MGHCERIAHHTLHVYTRHTSLFSSPRAPWHGTLLAGVLLFGLSGLFTTGPARAQARTGIANLEGQTRREAIELIPFDQLTDEAQQKLREVVERPSIYRRLPVTVIQSDPDLYVFLIRYPEVVVNMWQLMGVTKVTVQRTGDYTFRASDGAGTVSKVELVYGDRERHVFYGEGAYDGPLLRRLVRGRCVLVLKSEYQQTMDQRTYITNQLDMFVQLDNVGAEILARTLHPLVGKASDHNFVESTQFLAQVSQAAETRGVKLQQLSRRLANIQPDVRSRFSEVAELVSQRASMRHAGSRILPGTPTPAEPDLSLLRQDAQRQGTRRAAAVISTRTN